MKTPRPEHVPDGDPCSCGVHAYYHRDRHRPQHEPLGDPCAECGRDAKDHRKKNARADGRKGRSGGSRRVGQRAPRPSINAQPFVGVDGEGQNVGPVLPDGTRAGPHHYTYIAAVDEHGELRGDLSAKALGVTYLSTQRVLDWMLGLGVPRIFGYSAGYDLTKILADIPAEIRWRLVRPDKREYEMETSSGKTRTQHRAEFWFGFKLNYMKRRFSVQRAERVVVELPGKGRKKPRKKKVWKGVGPTLVFWDVFGFFQARFTLTLEDWKMLEKRDLAKMDAMKQDRGGDGWQDTEEVRDYCRTECHALARLCRKLVESGEAVGLTITQFYGAGSVAGALMKKLEVKKYMAVPPPEMHRAMMCGFVGGRFEFSAVGPIAGPVITDDISSAYPYQLTFLPCLACGKWEHVRADGPGGKKELARRIAKARLALVHARVHRTHQDAWGVFPWRAPNGTIVWPLKNAGTWIWKEEYEAGARLADVAPSEAWVYETACDHKPFEKLPELYVERIRIGKEGPGILLKLAMNSCYGRCAQSLGSNPPYQNWVFAGMITSGTRAQLLRSLEHVREPWDVLGFATDAVFSKVPLDLPTPKDTGTAVCHDPDGKEVRKPLGGWERKIHKRGMFLMRPGVYFPLEPTEKDLESKLIKARGMSGRVLLKNAEKILAHWKKYGTTEPVTVEGLRRFVGLASGVTKYGDRPAVESESYGEWVDYPTDVSLAPRPKRFGVASAASSPGGAQRLQAWPRMPGESSPYKKGNCDAEAKAEEEAKRFLVDQESGDFEM